MIRRGAICYMLLITFVTRFIGGDNPGGGKIMITLASLVLLADLRCRSQGATMAALIIGTLGILFVIAQM